MYGNIEVTEELTTRTIKKYKEDNTLSILVGIFQYNNFSFQIVFIRTFNLSFTKNSFLEYMKQWIIDMCYNLLLILPFTLWSLFGKQILFIPLEIILLRRWFTSRQRKLLQYNTCNFPFLLTITTQLYVFIHKTREKTNVCFSYHPFPVI